MESVILSSAALALLPAYVQAQGLLGSGELRIFGVALAVSPAAQTLPKNQATGLTTALVDPANPIASVSDPSLVNLVVKGELSGPGIGDQGSGAGSITLNAPAGQVLPIPPLLTVGNYVVDNLRLEDGQGTFIMAANPAVATLSVIDRVIVTSVSTQPLSLDQIQDLGIVLDSSNFSAYQFTFGIGTGSNVVPINLDVYFPKDKEADLNVGAGTVPVTVPGLDTPNVDFKGLLLTSPPLDGGNVQIPPIPAVIVIPGNIAFLHQFFQVIALVSNVAPAGSQLVVTSATATMILPVGADGIAHTTDDPLAPAKTAAGVPTDANANPITSLQNTTAGGAAFGPGEAANGDFDVEGLVEGTFQIQVTINAELQLATGQSVPLSGKAFGTVLVRNPNFALTFTHPDVVRAGETYSLLVTIHNTGGTATSGADANCVTLSLVPKDISGATLVSAGLQAGTPAPPNPCPPASGPGTVVVPTIKQNDAATVQYQLIARKNGQVTATGFTSTDPLTAGFVLRTGIGDHNIPLSPDSLILPPYVNDLPPDFFATALRVLGLAHSVATAPQGAPIGIQDRINNALVTQRAEQLTEAGLRIRIGDLSATSVGDLMLDWMGNCGLSIADCEDGGGNQFDHGFDEVMRQTDAGHDLEAAWAGVIRGAQAGTPAATLIGYQRTFATAEQYRPSFVSVAVAGNASIAIADDHQRQTAGASGGATLQRDVPGAVLLGFDTGQLAVIGSSAQSTFYDVTITGSGSVDVGVAWPDATGNLQQATFSGVGLANGQTAALHIVPGAAPPVLQLSNSQPVTVSTLISLNANAGPGIVGARQIPESDPLERGRVVAVLYDRDVDASAVQASLSYAAGQGPLATGPAQNSVKRTKVLSSSRIVLLNFESSLSRFFQYLFAGSGAVSPGGSPQHPPSDTRPVVPDFTTPVGGIVSGFVRKGTGDPIPFAPVELREWFVDDVTGLPIEIVTGQTTTDAGGYYRFDFVAQDDIGPFRVRAQDPDTGAGAQRQAAITQEHQEMRVDLLMLGLGRVTGTVVDAATGAPVADATVHVQSLTDGSDVQVQGDANGDFTADNVAVGDLLVAADAVDPNTNAVRSGSVAAILSSAGATATVTVLLYGQTGAVEGTVYDGGAQGLQPVGAGLQVVVFDDTSGDHFFERDVKTDGSGHFVIAGVPPGAMVVRVIRPETAQVAEVHVTVTAATTTPASLIFPGTASVVGTVLYPDGTPAPGIAVVGGMTLTHTDAKGNFFIPEVGLGHQVIGATNEATGAQAGAEIDIGTPGTVISVTIVLAGAGTISGRLFDSNGTPQAGVQVFLWFGEAGYLTTTTDRDGNYVFRDVPLGTDYTLRASAPDGDGNIIPVRLDTNNGAAMQNLSFRGMATVTGVVLAPDGVSPRTAQIVVSYQDLDSIGQVQDAQQTISSDQPVFGDSVGTQTCNAVCPPDTNCTGRFRVQIPIDTPYRLEATDSQFNGAPAAITGELRNPGDVDQVCLTLGQSGSVSGTVFLANGQPAVGVPVTYRVASETPEPGRGTTTDANGRYGFTLLAPRPFVVTAVDPASGDRGVARGSVLTGDATHVDVNLLGQGTVTVRVVGGTGQPVSGAYVDLKSGSPVAFLLDPFPTLQTGADGVVEFAGVPQGECSVTAQDPASLTGGAASGAIVTDHDSEEVDVILGASGTVTGTLYDATHTVPLSFAQVRLVLPSRESLYTTSDADGVYTFAFVPVNEPFSLEFFDPRTGRIGLGSGIVDYDTEVVTQDLTLLPIGTVAGTVTRQAGGAVANAQVTLSSALLVRSQGLSSDASLFGPGTLTTTTNLVGAYAIGGVPQGDCTVQANDPLTHATGTNSSCHVDSEGQAVTVDITLAGVGGVSGTVYRADGITPVAYTPVTLSTTSGTVLSTETDANGGYGFTGVPLGSFEVTAHEQGGHDGGSAVGEIVADQQAAVANVFFAGTGMINVTVVDTLGNPITTSAALTLVRQDLDIGAPPSGLQAIFHDFTDAHGRFSFSNIPTGSFTITATVVNTDLAGNASGTLSRDGQVISNLEIVIEPFASVGGTVYLNDQLQPASNVIVTLTSTSATSGQTFTAATSTAADGTFAFDHVPAGGFSLTAYDPVGHGFDRLTNQQIVAANMDVTETLVLDNRVPMVIGVSPPAGATGVALDTPIVISFSEAVDPSTVTANSVIVRSGGTALAGTLALDAGDDQVTFTATDGLPEFGIVIVEVNPNVLDPLGRPLATTFRASFQTADVTPPQVQSAGLVQGQLVIQWSKPINPAPPGMVSIIDTATSINAAGTFSFSNGNRTVIFKPNTLLADNGTFNVTISGWRRTPRPWRPPITRRRPSR